MITSAQDVKMAVNVTTNSLQDDHTLLTYKSYYSLLVRVK